MAVPAQGQGILSFADSLLPLAGIGAVLRVALPIDEAHFQSRFLQHNFLSKQPVQNTRILHEAKQRQWHQKVFRHFL